MAIAILLLALHWTLNGPKNVQSLLQLIPMSQRESISELISAIETKVGYFIAGQAVLCLIIGVMALIAYLIIGLPNALVLALVAGLMEAVPMVGPLLGAIPAGVIALSIAPVKLIWVVVASSYHSADGKYIVSAACDEESGGRQSICLPFVNFCFQFIFWDCRRTHGNSYCSHYSALTESLCISSNNS